MRCYLLQVLVDNRHDLRHSVIIQAENYVAARKIARQYHREYSQQFRRPVQIRIMTGSSIEELYARIRAGEVPCIYPEF